MVIKFRSNLGSIDAQALSLKHRTEVDFTKCTYKACVDFPEVAAKDMVEQGFADAVEAAEPPKIKAVAKKPDVTAPEK